MADSKIVPVILAGGSGTRLWPISRDSLPKQFLPLSTSGATLYQDTLQRVAQSDLFAAPIIVTHEEFRFFAQRQARDIGVEPTVMLEPVRRDSAPALLAATLLAQKLHGEEATLLVLAADHVIGDIARFHEACRKALATATLGHIVTFGITPTEPRTSYGYIRRGAALNGGTAALVEAFAEKPNAQTARDYIEAGYLWNSGNFLFPAHVMMEEAEAFEPEIVEAVRRAVAGSTSDLGFCRLGAAFHAAPSLSIDYAVLERTSRAAVVEGSFPWSDVGSWNALREIGEPDEAGNVTRGPVRAVDATNSYIHSEGPLVAAVGIEGLSVVATGDAVLIMPSERSEEVKHLVASLKAERRNEATEHPRMHRPWGSYETINLGGRFRVKKIIVGPGERLSLQRHHHRSEHWVVVHGTAEVTVDEKVFMVQENESTYIPLGAVHRLTNPGRIPLELIEVQVGSYLGEDDIVRLDDVYNRVEPVAPVAVS
ncbi:mannose-1-phosphate guanylyltransferase/mannose-6-phosphate isomerase [Ancylobacter dichloromethanicus]|uniref:mannose-1-phosphate guanylyltransferase n=1 Tax=Ancylobacter dichloromethanicus TaxID=518825 RepID=A0A9W6J6I0_9HYPH|nr:mannose-1-phosphate guanylyltransferase/mannose-6-phosphate isomerase [Ancylobacter dichloromethanicus]MBS7556350.1 mannose-1-phosphate guanylyltransferase/mannose-6-phosphate isomerase [Ancylobacter dichloromethanicus]GLK70115.1 mannose-1-phosphate guanylyltransferase/mannose-6-phosphate isomerase [Ancylobacter dichloromethanicus]